MPDPPRLRLIGDVHGEYDRFRRLVAVPWPVLQVGDLSLNYRPFACFDSTRIRAISGNHDCFDGGPGDCRLNPLFLGDFGHHDVPGLPPIFYARGAWSIDGHRRQVAAARGAPVSWWPDEELDDAAMARATALYTQTKPVIVVTHDAPASVIPRVADPYFPLRFGYPAGAVPTRTSTFLEGLLQAHRPALWVFGHYHVRKEWVEDGTQFVALADVGPDTPRAQAILDLTAVGFAAPTSKDAHSCPPLGPLFVSS